MDGLRKLGSLFDNIKAVNGPVIIASHSDLYFLGENHTINGMTNNGVPHILDIIYGYASRNPKQGISLIIEAHAVDLQMMSSLYATAPSPIKAFANRLLHHQFAPTNVHTILADARRGPPFCIFEAVYDFETLNHLYNSVNDKDYVAKYATLWTLSKRFEKELFSHIASRKALVALLTKLVHPDETPPRWFVAHLNAFGIPDTVNDVKDTLTRMKASKPELFHSMMQVFSHLLKLNIEDNSNYSRAMERAEATRHSKTRFVAEKHPMFKTLLIALNSIFMDFRLLIDLYTESKTHDVVIVLAGKDHIINLLRTMSVEFQFVEDANGTISSASKVVTNKALLPKGLSPKWLARKFALNK